RPCPLSL
ncbi:hypothetical protein BN1708_019778, partial [Verticillium longisporum]